MPAGAGTPSYKKGWLVVGDVWVPFAPPLGPLDSGPVSGYWASFRLSDLMALARTRRRMKIGPLVGRRPAFGGGQAPALHSPHRHPTIGPFVRRSQHTSYGGGE